MEIETRSFLLAFFLCFANLYLWIDNATQIISFLIIGHKSSRLSWFKYLLPAIWIFKVIKKLDFLISWLIFVIICSFWFSFSSIRRYYIPRINKVSLGCFTSNIHWCSKRWDDIRWKQSILWCKRQTASHIIRIELNPWSSCTNLRTRCFLSINMSFKCFTDTFKMLRWMYMTFLFHNWVMLLCFFNFNLIISLL